MKISWEGQFPQVQRSCRPTKCTITPQNSHSQRRKQQQTAMFPVDAAAGPLFGPQTRARTRALHGLGSPRCYGLPYPRCTRTRTGCSAIAPALVPVPAPVPAPVPVIVPVPVPAAPVPEPVYVPAPLPGLFAPRFKDSDVWPPAGHVWPNGSGDSKFPLVHCVTCKKVPERAVCKKENGEMQCRGCALDELSDKVDALGPSPPTEQVQETVKNFDTGLQIYKYEYEPKRLPPPPTGYPLSKCMCAVCKKPALHAHEVVKEVTPQMLQTASHFRVAKLVVGDVVCGICRNEFLAQYADNNVVLSKSMYRGTQYCVYKGHIDEVFQYNEELHKMAERAQDNTHDGPSSDKFYWPRRQCQKCMKRIDINVQNLYVAPRPRSLDVDLVCYECAKFCSLVSEAVAFPGFSRPNNRLKRNAEAGGYVLYDVVGSNKPYLFA
eukprot:jgi/Mesvir1/6572/Mv25658-RA.1